MITKGNDDVKVVKEENIEQPMKPIDSSAYELINVQKVNFDKKVLFVYNPASGKRKDKKTLIEKFCKDNKIEYELYVTKK